MIGAGTRGTGDFEISGVLEQLRPEQATCTEQARPAGADGYIRHPNSLFVQQCLHIDQRDRQPMRCGQLFNRLENHWADVDAAGVCVTPRALLRDMAQTVAFTKLGRADARALAGEARLMAATGTTSATSGTAGPDRDVPPVRYGLAGVITMLRYSTVV